VGEDFTYEKSRPQGFKLSEPDRFAATGYHRSPYVGEHVHLLHAILTGQPLNETRDVALATGAAILGRESAYTGKRITWSEMFDDPQKNPAMYNLACKPSAEDFETGQVVLLKDGEIRIPGSA
jgi:myo-inositol 2-dehydrogenase / D-chiro-inositol 1-dehydrogenase